MTVRMESTEYGVLITDEDHTWQESTHRTEEAAINAGGKQAHLISLGIGAGIVTVVQRQVVTILGDWHNLSDSPRK